MRAHWVPWGCIYFNPRSHERCDSQCRQLSVSSTYFNPRSHERSDTRRQGYLTCSMISIHAPTRGATQAQEQQQEALQNFNPRSHERSDDASGIFTAPIAVISIHAPTRGATIYENDLLFYLNISIHAPTRGATFSIARRLITSLFQSTLPREERPKILQKYLYY